MSTRVRNYVRNHHVGLIALFLVLTGGTAYALDGSNTVFSDDIVNLEVQTPDIDSSAVNSGKVQNDSLIGNDVVESSLGQVPSAALGGTGRWDGGTAPTCDPGNDFFFTCDFVSIDLPAPSRVLVMGVVNATKQSGGGNAHGRCLLATHLGDLPGSTVPVLVDNGSLLNGAGELVPLIAITSTLGPGAVDFAVRCNQQGSADIEYDHVQIAAVALSPN